MATKNGTPGAAGALLEVEGLRARVGDKPILNGVDLAGPDLEIEPLEDLPVADPGAQPLHRQHAAHPTLPSSDSPSNFCASTANSIGSSLSTWRAKPFTIIETASSSEMPRCRQ